MPSSTKQKRTKPSNKAIPQAPQSLTEPVNTNPNAVSQNPHAFNAEFPSRGKEAFRGPNDQAGYPNQQPGYLNPQAGYLNQQPTSRNHQPRYPNAKPNYPNARPSYSDAQLTHTNAQLTHTNAQLTHTNAQLTHPSHQPTYHPINRPWPRQNQHQHQRQQPTTTQPPRQGLTDTQLSHWMAESPEDGPYHGLASVKEETGTNPHHDLEKKEKKRGGGKGGSW